jgi:hypothetical protein
MGIELSISTCDGREARLARNGKGRLGREEVGTSLTSWESKGFPSTCKDCELNSALNV